MPVRYTPPTPESLLPVAGIALGPAAGRIRNWQRDDVLLVTCAPGTVAAGVFTQNRFCAAPVIVCREHLAHQLQTTQDGFVPGPFFGQLPKTKHPEDRSLGLQGHGDAGFQPQPHHQSLFLGCIGRQHAGVGGRH